MGAAIGLREDFGSADVRALARSSEDADQARRHLALISNIRGQGRALSSACISSSTVSTTVR